MTGKETGRRNFLEIVMIIVTTFLVGLLLILQCGANPAEAMALFGRGLFGSLSGFTEIFVKACPLVLTGLGCAVAFQTGFFNIGAEGQFYVGAMISTIISLNFKVNGVPNIFLSLLAGFIGGGIWALVAAILKTKYNISEIIVTIMLNYIAINFLGYALRSFLQDPNGNVPQSSKIAEANQLKSFVMSTRLHAGILIALLAVVFVRFFMTRTTAGFEMKAVGFNKRASSCVGIPVLKNMIFSAFLSGGLAALAGGIEVMAIQKKLLEGISAECGYTAVLIALIAGNRPVGVLAASLIYAALEVGSSSMQRQLGVPSAIVEILIGTVVVLILGRNLLSGMFFRKAGFPAGNSKQKKGENSI